MRWKAFARSSIGAKVGMALTGLLLFGFVLAHLSGNLLIFRGADAVNEYAAWLRAHPWMLWTARLGLLAATAVHVGLAIRIQRTNRAARPVPYAVKESQEASFASRSMMLTGVTLAAYVLFHLAHFTWGWVQRDTFAEIHQGIPADVYTMTVRAFQVPALAFLYILAMLVLGLHLAHGMGAFAQTFGLHRTPLNRPFRAFGNALAALVVLGYLSIPLAVLAGWIAAGAEP